MFVKRFAELQQIIESLECSVFGAMTTSSSAVSTVWELLQKVKKQEGIVYVIGNGGSAGIASHFCIDLLNTLKIPSQTLYDSNVFSCFANDYGYGEVFRGPLSTLLRSNDVLIAISSSGKSANIVHAAQMARQQEVSVITLTGFSADNPLRKLGDVNVWLPSSDYGLVEVGHLFLLHTMIDIWKQQTEILYTYLHARQS